MKLHRLFSACAVFLIVCTPTLIMPAIGQNTKKIPPEFSDVDGIQSEFASIKSPESKSKLKTVVGQNASPIVKLMEFPGSGMSGTYQVPGSSHDGYPLTNIGTAIAILNSVGLVGDVVFELTDTSYNESSVVIGGAYLNADIYKVKIQPVLGDSVKVHFISTSSDGKGFVFNGAKNVTIDGLNTGGASLTLDFNASGSVFPIDDPFGTTVYITGASDRITFKNTHIKGHVNNTVWVNQTEGRPAFFIFTADADAGPSVDITLDSCTITNATYAIKALPQSTGHRSVEKFTVKNCKIGGAYGEPVVIGALVEYSAEITYTKNIVDGVTSLSNYLYNTYTEYDDVVYNNGGPFMYSFRQVTGGHWLMMDEGTWADNIFRNITTTTINGDGIGCYGIRVYGYDLGYGGVGYVPTLYNNRIYGITNDDNNGYIFGIRGVGVNIYHNSVRLTGTNTNSPTTSCCKADNYNVKNNAFSNEISQPDLTKVNGVTVGGTIDGNAIYSTGQPTNHHSTVNAAVAAGVNPKGIWGSVNFTSDLSINCPSSADNSALPGVLLAGDINGVSRDTTTGGVRDAGAYEFPTCWTSFGPDVFPAKLVSPVAYLTGCPQAVKVLVKNNRHTPVGPFNLNVVISGSENYNATNSISLMPMECKTITMTQQWNPTGGGSRMVTVTTYLSGDINTANDIINATILSGDPIGDIIVYTFDAGPQGWVGTTGPGSVTDWKRSNSFTKLGGPFEGYSWVIERPNKPSTYTEGAYASSQGYTTSYPGPNLLTSPVFDFRCYPASKIYLGFYHSMRTEPYWDRSWMQYTTDGIKWKHLGKLNDTNGVNWYSENLYHNADWDPVDEGWILYEEELDTTLPLAAWTSNGFDHATGPFGWVVSFLKITSSEYPDIFSSPNLQFRYVAYSDAAWVEDPGGWAFDNFFLSSLAPEGSGLISGIVFHDLNGNGTQDAGESGDDGAKMYVYYYDVLIDSIITSGGGQYTFNLWNNNGIPGVYGIKCIYPGYAFSVPFGVSGIAEIFHPADGSPITQNFGRYLGSVSGMKFEDANGNGSKDPEDSGFGGWTIELRKDSVVGELINSVVTASGGSYTMLAPPYTNYILKENLTDTLIARCTYPPDPGSYSLSVKGNSGSDSAIISGQDFGNFVKALMRIEITQDRNGDGVRDSLDGLPLPAETGKMYFDILKNGTRIVYDSLFNGQGYKLFAGLEMGTYLFRILSPAPSGWIRTSQSDSITFVIGGSGFKDTASFLYFHKINVAGMKFNDLDMDGVKDEGESGLSGWSISLCGTECDTTITDSNGNYLFEGFGPGQYVISEALQDGWVQTAPAVGIYTFSAVTADQNGNKSGMNFGNYDGSSIYVLQGWNLISLPVILNDGRSDVLFPAPTYSELFRYSSTPTGGYLTSDTMYNRIGYWIKSSIQQSKQLTGYSILSDSIEVTPGWNLIGTISVPVPVSLITSNPAGLTVSQFFGYSGQYTADDTLKPGVGYWIKAVEEGKIYLTSGQMKGLLSRNKINIVPTSELPPPPPFREGSVAEEIPKEYNLEQNYPNPFNPLTKIRYALPVMSNVRLTVFNILGQEVVRLIDGIQDAGYKEIDWDASAYVSGIYFYRIQAISASDPANPFTQVRKMLLIR